MDRLHFATEDEPIFNRAEFMEEPRVETIVDWKSDVDAATERLMAYRAQIDTYRRETGAERARCWF